MEDELEELRVEALIQHMTGIMIMNHFLDLAAAFAIVDKIAARATLDAIEHDMARGLMKLRDEFVKGSGGDHILRPVATNLRDTMKLAREKMDQATKPN